MVETIEIEISGQRFKLARTPSSRVAGVTGSGTIAVDTREGLLKLYALVYYGIKRADPETSVTVDWIDENVDSMNLLTIFKKFADFNAMRPSDLSSGEASPASPL